MIATLLEATEMIGLPIILLSGFMLIALLALLMVILRKEKSYEDIVREREMKLGDIGEDKSVKVAKKKVTHKPKKSDTTQIQTSPTANVSESATSEEETITVPVEKSNSPPSPKPSSKQKKTKKQAPETASLPSDFTSVEEIVVTSQSSQALPEPVTESLPVLPTPAQDASVDEVPSKKKTKSKKKKEDGLQNGEINWTETNGQESDQFYFLTNQVNALSSENEDLKRNYTDLSSESRMKETEINRLKTTLNTAKVNNNQQMTVLKNENTRIKQQLQTASSQSTTIPQLQEELDKRRTHIDNLKGQLTSYKSQQDSQLQQLQATLDKKEVERARILQDRDATLEELNEANLAIAGLTTDNKKRERQAQELAANSPSIETELNAKITSLQSSLEASEKEAQAKVRLEFELNQKQESITEQQTAIDKLQDELSSRDVVSDDKSHSELENKVRDYEQKIEELSVQVGDWEESVSFLNTEMTKLRHESVPATDLNELQSEISEKENQIYRLTVLVENSQKEMDAIGDIMSEFQDLKLKTEDLQSENDILQAKTVTSDLDDSSVADLASKHAILKASINQYEDMIEQHKEENERMKTNLSDAETKFQEKEEDNKIIRDRLDSFKKKNNDLRDTIWKMKDDVDSSRKSVEQESKSAKENIKGFFGQIFPNLRAHGQDFDDWLVKIKGAATDYISRLEEDVKSTSQALTESSVEAEKERDKVKDLLVRDKLQTEENESLRKTIVDTEGEILVLQSQVEAEFAKLKEDLNSEQKKAFESETIIEDKDMKLSDSLVKIESLNQETESLKKSVLPELHKSLKRRDTELQELTYQMDSLAQKKEQLENDLASTHRQNCDEMERTNSLQAENDSLFGMSEITQGYKIELAEAKELIKSLQSNQTDSTDQLKQEMNVLDTKLIEIQEENEILKQKHRELESYTDGVPNANNNNDVDTPKSKKPGPKSPKLPRQPSETTAL